ncbi:hypothetical protein ACHAPT_002821 [Fusarium lateritium]
MDAIHPAAMSWSLQQHSAHNGQRGIREFTLDDQRLIRRCPLDNGRHLGEPRHSLGQLDLLPAELLRDVLISLDVPSLTALRRVNRRAMSSVDSLYEYAALFKHCPDVIRGIISINADGYSCKALFKTLSTSRCDVCNCFGYYLYLVTCKRVCYMCFKYGVKHFPVREHYVFEATGLEHKKLDQVPHILGLPTRRALAGEPRVKLYDIEAALEQVGKDALDPRPRQDRIQVCQRFLALISAPYLQSAGRSADWGHYCTGCRTLEPGNCFLRKFTREEFADHVAKQRGGAMVVKSG